jgi:catechol 2,3-dioxygenase-like lactoylglutathione lyase family enzyme
MAARKKAAAKKKTRKVARGAAAARKSAPKRRSAKPAFKERKEPETLRLRSATPGFTVNDVEKSLRFYRDILGFVVTERWMHDGKLGGVELAAGDISFMLGQDDWKKGRNRPKGEGFRMYCITAQSVDRLSQQILARGGELTQGPTDQPWGMRDFAVTDPDGFKITIAAELKKR